MRLTPMSEAAPAVRLIRRLVSAASALLLQMTGKVQLPAGEMSTPGRVAVSQSPGRQTEPSAVQSASSVRAQVLFAAKHAPSGAHETFAHSAPAPLQTPPLAIQAGCAI